MSYLEQLESMLLRVCMTQVRSQETQGARHPCRRRQARLSAAGIPTQSSRSSPNAQYLRRTAAERQLEDPGSASTPRLYASLPVRGPDISIMPESEFRTARPEFSTNRDFDARSAMTRNRRLMPEWRFILIFRRAPNRHVLRRGVIVFSIMPTTKRPDPELLPIHRPPCPDCQKRMITADIASGPEGFECRTFECPKCGHSETRMVASDPLRSDVAGWIAGGPPLQR
jgi:hypothetical protein